MLRILKGVIIVLFASVFLVACAIAPRTSDWTSPKKFTQAQVFNAAVSAGAEMGYSATSIDRTTYNLTLTRAFADKTMTLMVRVRDQAGKMNVASIVSFNDVAFAGAFEETIKNFHAALFRNLNIDQSELNNVIIQEGK